VTKFECIVANSTACTKGSNQQVQFCAQHNFAWQTLLQHLSNRRHDYAVPEFEHYSNEESFEPTRPHEEWVRKFGDRRLPLHERLEAGRQVFKVGPFHDPSFVMVEVFVNEKEATELRLLAVQGLELTKNVNRLFFPCKDPIVRAAAVQALHRIGDSPHVDILARDVELIKQHLKSGVCDTAVIVAVCNLGLTYGRDGKAIEALRMCFSSDNAAFRSLAVLPFAQVGEMDLVHAALNDPDEEVRRQAAEAYGYYGVLGTDAEIDSLKARMQDPSSSVRKAALTALKRLKVLSAPKPKRNSKDRSASQFQVRLAHFVAKHELTLA